MNKYCNCFRYGKNNFTEVIVSRFHLTLDQSSWKNHWSKFFNLTAHTTNWQLGPICIFFFYTKKLKQQLSEFHNTIQQFTLQFSIKKNVHVFSTSTYMTPMFGFTKGLFILQSYSSHSEPFYKLLLPSTNT